MSITGLPGHRVPPVGNADHKAPSAEIQENNNQGILLTSFENTLLRTQKVG